MSAHLAPAQLAELALEPRVDPHLAECAQCREQLAKFASAVGTLQRAYAPKPEAPFVQSRLIASAIAGAEHAALQAPAWFQRRTLWLLAAVPVAVVALVMFWPRALPADGFRLVSGAPVIAGRQVSVSAGAVAAVVALADGTRIQAEPGTRFEVATGARVVLSRGAIRLWVEKRPTAPLIVETAEARVRVIGTIFSVSHSPASGTRVEVTEGIVEVMAKSLATPRRLTVGQALDVPVAEPQAQPPAAHDVEVSTPAQPEPEPPAGPAAKKNHLPSKPKRPVDAERVRAQVRAGRFDEARTLLAVERAQAHSQSDAAELDIVEAEMLLASGRRGDALEAYLGVSERHRDLRQGEAALFAAAQLTLTNDRERAASLLRRYRQRYPNGRFAQEATDLLRVMTPP